MAALPSFGDILTLVNLAWTIANILRDSTGHRVLDRIPGSYRGTRSSGNDLPEFGPVRFESQSSEAAVFVENTLKFALSKCQTLMSGFLKRVEGYHRSLKKGGSVILAAMQFSMQQIPRALGYTWEGGNNHKVIWLINAVGNKLPIPIELCITRATFEGLLRVYFKNRAGIANNEVCEIKDGDDHIRLGMTITTRMIYVQWDDSLQGEVCPCCQRAVSVQNVSGFTCSFCGTSVRNYAHLQDQFPARTAIACENEPGLANAGLSFAASSSAKRAHAAPIPGQRVSYWDGLRNTIYAVVKRFGLMVQEVLACAASSREYRPLTVNQMQGRTVYNVRREPDGAHMCLL
ncbi:hypothetical protein B0H17DRAFT_1191244 [Mycena rosella]|uniref:Ubiquitin-like domain-containing protein n=1 Tax=Mycena rosella TaxID=1033263 RepID=A0AAD7GZP6_MYCRO|nr:hypothetical protein B0H17DRAFT_1191244 [Mycena rosella]